MARRKGGRRYVPSEDEPRPDPESVYDGGGGEAIVAVDFTGWGFPIGATVSEFREGCARDEPGAGWARAKRAIAGALHRAAPSAATDVHVDFVRKMGAGLLRGAWGAEVWVSPDPIGLSGDWVALIPGSDADRGLEARVIQEIRLLAWLARRELPFRAPRAMPYAGDGILVRRWLAGVPLDLRAGRQSGVRPWRVAGALAAAVHRIEPPDFVPGPATRSEHALAELEVLKWLDDPLADEAHLWALERLPPDEPSVFLHGDLRADNVLVGGDEPPALIDWECARRGDPAYDLAVVTRGVRRPFGLPDGLDKLLEVYEGHGGSPLRVEDVRLHELALLGGAALGERQGSRHREVFRHFTRRLLRRPPTV